jgi:hypothetical protein
MPELDAPQVPGDQLSPRPPWRAFPTVLASSFAAHGTDYRVEVDWLAAGCPGALCLALGDQLLDVPLPPGFPATGLDFRVQPVVYDRPQVARVRSTPGRTVRNLELVLATEGLDVPFLLACQGGPVLEGWTRDDEFEEPSIYTDSSGTRHYIYRRRLQGLEKEIAGGGPCRPDCRWQSVYVQRSEDRPVLDRVEFEQGGLVKVEIFRYNVGRVWKNFHCENGRWTLKSTVVDQQVQRFARRLQAF